jgi:hypothetical protein
LNNYFIVKPKLLNFLFFVEESSYSGRGKFKPLPPKSCLFPASITFFTGVVVTCSFKIFKKHGQGYLNMNDHFSRVYQKPSAGP